MKDAKLWIIMVLLVANALTLGILVGERRANATVGLGDMFRLTGIIDLERRLQADAVALVGDAGHLRQRASALLNELNLTNQRLTVTDGDLAKLNRDLNELRQYRDIVKRATGR